MNSIEEKVEKILNRLGEKSAPINVAEIAAKSDVLIKKAASQKFSGVLFRKGNIAFMAISKEEPPTRQRFTIAHELGHYFLHPQTDTFIEFRKKNTKYSAKENEANRFAAALLMPRKLLEKDVQSFKETGLTSESIRSLALKYDVSEDAMNFRLINLHLSR